MSVILCTSGYDRTIRFWDAVSGICTRTIAHPDSQVNRLCISPDKRFLAAAGSHSVKLYDIRSKKSSPVMSFDGHTANVTAVAFHCKDEWMVTSSEDGTLKIWNTKTGAIQREYSHESPSHDIFSQVTAVNDVVIHPNQGELISCDRSGSIRVWDLVEDRCTHHLIPQEDVSVSSVSVASDGSLLCAGNNTGKVYVWRMMAKGDVTSLIPFTSFQPHSTYITRVLISPDVRHLATCSADHAARIWSLDLKAPHKIKENEDAPTDRLPGAFPLELSLDGHQRWVWDCVFTADSAYLITASSDHYARLWELSSGEVMRQYHGHHRGLVCVALDDYIGKRSEA